MPRAIALRANRLVALEAGTGRLFNATTGELISRWPVPSGVEPRIDVHFGVAVLTRGHTVFGIDLETGHTVALAHSRAPIVNAEIDNSGVVYAFNLNRTGHAHFISFADVEAALR